MNWNQVFELPAIEFLVYITFFNYKTRKREQQVENFKRRTKK